VAVAESPSSSAAAVTVVRSIVRTVARQSLVAIQYSKQVIVTNKAGKADLTMPNACAVTGCGDKK
jgi:hypothetical protein